MANSIVVGQVWKFCHFSLRTKDRQRLQRKSEITSIVDSIASKLTTAIYTNVWVINILAGEGALSSRGLGGSRDVGPPSYVCQVRVDCLGVHGVGMRCYLLAISTRVGSVVVTRVKVLLATLLWHRGMNARRIHKCNLMIYMQVLQKLSFIPHLPSSHISLSVPPPPPLRSLSPSLSYRYYSCISIPYPICSIATHSHIIQNTRSCQQKMVNHQLEPKHPKIDQQTTASLT